MTRIKTLLGLVTAVGLFAILAIPASAEWKSLNGTSQGPSQLKTGTTAVFKVAEKSPELKCAKVPDEWHLLKSDAAQGPVTTGGHLQIKSKWEECTVEVILIKVPVTVSGCILEMKQAAGVFTATGSVITTCVVVIEAKPSCTIEVSGQNGENQDLKEIKLVNVETKNQEDVINVSGIKSKTPVKTPSNATNEETCKKLGVIPGVGTFKAFAIEHEINAF